MRYEDVGVGEVMQLPDECFGDRYWVTVSVDVTSQGAGGLSYGVLPEAGVFWGFSMWGAAGTLGRPMVELAYSDHAPSSVAQLRTWTALFGELRMSAAVPCAAVWYLRNGQLFLPMRRRFTSVARRVAVWITPLGGLEFTWQVGVLVSGMPRGEMPRWLS